MLHDKRPAAGESVMLPDLTEIEATSAGDLPIGDLTQQATKALVLPRLGSASLVSLGQLCDDDYQVLLTKKDLTVFKGNRRILHR